MPAVSFRAGRVYCYDCVIALRKFIGSLEGVRSIEMDGEEKIDILYDSSVISEEKLTQIVNESVERLGFKIEKVL